MPDAVCSTTTNSFPGHSLHLHDGLKAVEQHALLPHATHLGVTEELSC
jgi:hypothetical protein